MVHMTPICQVFNAKNLFPVLMWYIVVFNCLIIWCFLLYIFALQPIMQNQIHVVWQKVEPTNSCGHEYMFWVSKSQWTQVFWSVNMCRIGLWVHMNCKASWLSVIWQNNWQCFFIHFLVLKFNSCFALWEFWV